MDLSDFETLDKLNDLELSIDILTEERDLALAQVKRLRKDLIESNKRAALSEQIAASIKKPPKWLTPKRKKKEHYGTVCALLSDTHFDENVNAVEMGGTNEYNREIATDRLKNFFSKTIELSRDYTSGVTYDGAVLFLGGDIVSGDIHEELKESNEDTTLGTVVYWTEQLTAGVKMLGEHFEKVHIPCVVGNHGRRTRKARMKNRARDNFDWFIYVHLAAHFKDHPTITFDVSDEADSLVDIYNTRFLLTHGDQVSGGQGIGGIWPPIKRMQARKQINTPHDVLVMGHWHQLIQAATNGLIVNGSLKGWDEYAKIQNFAFEPPAQAWWVVTPEHGVTFQAPIFV